MAKNQQSTHQIIDVKDISDGVVELKNGNLRTVLMVSSINFNLKSEDERKAIIGGFQRLLNSLDFSLQIIVHSRSLDLSEYFAFLRERRDAQENELLRIQTSEYIDFVREMVKLSNIMSKVFYVVVPYNVSVVEKSGFLQNFLPGKKDKKEDQKKASKQEAKKELSLRVDHLRGLLGEMGLRSVPLKDRELAELFYGLYNPGVSIKQTNMELLVSPEGEAKQ